MQRQAKKLRYVLPSLRDMYFYPTSTYHTQLGLNEMASSDEKNTAYATTEPTMQPIETHLNASVSSSDQLSSPDAGMENSKSLHGFHGRAPHEQSAEMRKASTKTFAEINVSIVGRIYRRIMNLPPAARYSIYIGPVAFLLAIPILVLGLQGVECVRMGDAEDREGHHIEGPHLLYFMIWVEAMWLAFWVIKLFAWALPYIFKFFAGVVNAGVRKYVVVLENLVRPMSFMLWTLILWLTYMELMIHVEHTPDVPWVVTLRKILAATFISSVVLLIEKTIVQIIAVGYHQRSFSNRIKASKKEIWLLDMLYSTSRQRFPLYCAGVAAEDYITNCGAENKSENWVHSDTTFSSAPPVRQSHVKRLGGKFSSTVRSLTSETIGRTVFRQDPMHSTVINALENKHRSEALARRVWLSFARERKTLITTHDFLEILANADRKNALEAFEMFDQDANGNICLEDMVYKTVGIGEERRAIFGGIRNIGDTLKAFDKVLMVVVVILTAFIFVAFFKQNVITVLAAASTAILSLSFAFAATAQEFLGSCIFLFVKHPYDVGDRVDVNRSWAVVEPLIVEEISLLYTVFRGIDTMKIVQAPNIQLNDVWIDNFSRSGEMVEKIAVDVAFETTAADIELLRQKMEEFVNAPENCRDFQSDFNIACGGVGNLDKLTLHATIKHKSNWHNEAIRSQRRSKFMTSFAEALRKIPIYPPGGGSEPLGGHSNPKYTVAVTDKFASQSRQQAAEAKEAARCDQERWIRSSYSSGNDDRRGTEETLGCHPSIFDLRQRSSEVRNVQHRQTASYPAYAIDETSSVATFSRAESIPVSPMGSHYDIEAQLETNQRDGKDSH